ncbi:hypothetical protein TNCT_641441 [Trichonephila clavata]|uniref:Uncharacterized protein n=1 Tax=Trichonephila clavata TaxID=2740835 RepID=A0A8X6J369_TRICU|nr:hypothetical protein TNCT_641441 [Trichonephila clavata]
MFKQIVHFKNGRYEVELLRKREGNEMSDNFNLMKRPLESLMRKMQSDKVLDLTYKYKERGDVGTTVLLEKPTEGNWTVIAVKDAANHVKDDHVRMEHVRAEISTFFKNVNNKFSFYDLGNFMNVLSDYEKRQIIDMGPLQLLGPFPR